MTGPKHGYLIQLGNGGNVLVMHIAYAALAAPNSSGSISGHKKNPNTAGCLNLCVCVRERNPPAIAHPGASTEFPQNLEALHLFDGRGCADAIPIT